MPAYGEPEYGVDTYGSGGLFSNVRGMPLVQCWIAFGSNPGAASPTWTDVSQYLRGFSTRRGREFELDQFQAGTATITLDNRDRRFDPDYALSPYYPNVVPMRRVKLVATYGAEATLFDGYIDGWPQLYNQPNEARTTVTATDAFKILSMSAMPSSVYEYEIQQDAPVHWWRLNEKQGAVAADQGSDPVDGTYSGVIDYAIQGSSPFDGDTAIGFVDPTGNGGGHFFASTPSVPATGDFTVEFWVQDPATEAGNGTYWAQAPQEYTLFAAYMFAIFVDDGAGGWTVGSGFIIQGEQETVTVSADVPALAEPGWHQMVTTRSGSTFEFYVDGILVPTIVRIISSSGGVTTPDSYSGAITSGGTHLAALAPAGRTIKVDELATYDSALSAARIRAHYGAAISGWAGETTDERIERALDIAGFPASQRSLEVGRSAMGAAVLNSQAVTEHIQDASLAEGGDFFIAADGTATFYNRHHLITTPATDSVATFGDDFQ